MQPFLTQLESIVSCNPFVETPNTAYVTYVINEKESGFAICLADGTQLAIFPTRDAAYFTARQHDLEPCHVH
jgi:hypothetical protein